ncbi:MAG: hypothetical protein K9K67_01335 [Bacteriovoracaceae bacterium]|nr:hypothetical protein [Bacteriovoracaceae bacterium]
MKVKKIILYPFLYLLMVFLIALNSKFNAFEGNLYNKKLLSIVKDNDFNVVNNTQPPWSTLITATDNVGDMHDFGAPILWAGIIKTYNLFFNFDEIVLNFENVFISNYDSFFIVFHLFLLFFIRKWEIEKGTREWLFWAIILSLSIHDYLIDNIFNADIMALFFMSYITHSILKKDLSKAHPTHAYSLGLTFGLLRAIKITSILYLPAFLLFFLLSIPNKKESFQFIARFLLGFALILLTILINNYTILGDWSFLQGYNYSYALIHPLNLNGWKATYLYPRSLFLHSVPILVMLVTYILFSIKKAKSLEAKNIFFLVAGAGILLKLSLGIFGAADHFLGVGARQFFLDIPVILFFLSWAYEKQKRLTTGCVVFGILSAIYFNCEWLLLNKDPEAFSLVPLLNFKENLIFAFSLIPYVFKKIFFVFRFCVQDFRYISVFIFFTSIVLISSVVRKNEKLNSLLPFICASVFIYISFLNLKNNINNTYDYFLKNGYSNRIIGATGKLYLYHEINSGLALGRAYEDRYGTTSSQVYSSSIHKAHLNEIRNDILFIGREVNPNGIQSGYLDPRFPFNEPLIERSAPQSK